MKMLSLSSDTLESSGSREFAPVDYGQSRSSTPDSSASSRLAAQLERSAYRRSRSNVRRKQKSSDHKSDHHDSGAGKSSRNKQSKNQQRNQLRAEEDFTKINGSYVAEESQGSSLRRTFAPDEERAELISGSNHRVDGSREPLLRQYSEERIVAEPEDGSRILKARPVSAYTVSCVTVEDDDHFPLSLNDTTEEHSGRKDTIDASSRSHRSQEELKYGVQDNRGRRSVGLSSNIHDKPTGNYYHHETRRNDSAGMSKVRFEKSWEDIATKTVGYKATENSANTNGTREGDSARVSNNASGDCIVPEDCIAPEGYNALESNSASRSNYRQASVDKSDAELKETLNTTSTIHPVKHWSYDEYAKKKGNTTATVRDQPGRDKDIKEDATYQKKSTTVNREVYNKSDYGAKQAVPEVSRVDESKSLGLRQLIRIHEVQIAEVAKSAAAMKKPSGGKFQEGRLVKVKVVPEIETKQAHTKQRAAKVSFTKNNVSPEENDNSRSSRNMSVIRGNVNDDSTDAVSHMKSRPHSNSDETLNSSRVIVQPKHRTVELRRPKPGVPQEDQKWKRHTAIGLVGSDYQEAQTLNSANGRLPTQDSFQKPLLVDDGYHEADYPRQRPVEAEKQVINEKVKRCDVVDLKAKKLNEIDEVLKSCEVDSDEDDVPPERPPLPENFYSGTEDMLARPRSPAANHADMSTQAVSKMTAPSNEIIKPSLMTKRTRDSPPCPTIPAVKVSSPIERIDSFNLQPGSVEEDKDTVLGNSRTTREMYEERLARINLVPLDIPDRICSDQKLVSSQCTSLESFTCENNLDKNTYVEKLKMSLKELKLLKKEKEELEKNFELELRDWKRKYEEQQKVANAYQKLEDRYRRRVEELQEALMQCSCSETETRKALLGQPGKRTDAYFFTSNTQSILDETEEWLKEQSERSEITHNSEVFSHNARMTNNSSPGGSLPDVAGPEWIINYKDFNLATNIDQYNATSV